MARAKIYQGEKSSACKAILSNVYHFFSIIIMFSSLFKKLEHETYYGFENRRLHLFRFKDRTKCKYVSKYLLRVSVLANHCASF